MITKTVRYGFGNMRQSKIEEAITSAEDDGWAVRQIAVMPVSEYSTGSLYVVYEKEV